MFVPNELFFLNIHFQQINCPQMFQKMLHFASQQKIPFEKIFFQ
jgi:hypothetical protein